MKIVLTVTICDDEPPASRPSIHAPLRDEDGYIFSEDGAGLTFPDEEMLYIGRPDGTGEYLHRSQVRILED